MAAYDPFIGANPVVNAMSQQRGRQEQTRENTGRLATCFTRWTTTGTGAKIIEDVFDFDCTFIEEPGMSAGFALDESGPDLDVSSVPSVSVGIYRWQKNVHGFYTGAWLFFKVTASVNYVCNHFLSFTGMAIKDLPAYTLDF